MTERLHLDDRHRRTLEALLREHLPDVEVWACGSRAAGRGRDGSGLDLVLRGSGLVAIPAGQLLDFEEALRESRIPFLVEARDWARLPERVHAEIERGHVVLAEGRTRGRTVSFGDAFLINPPTDLKRGHCYPFVDMASVLPDSRSVAASKTRPYSGSGSRFVDGDTLMARITPCLENGKVSRYRATCDVREAHGSTEFIVVRGSQNLTDSAFAYYATRSDAIRDYAIGQMTGTSGRQRVPVDALANLPIKLPPLPEQRAIARILGALDDKIELNRRMNATLEAMARALFKSWFVDFDPVRAKMAGRDAGLPKDVADLFPDRLVDSELGEIPEGWDVQKLSDVAEGLRQKENPLKSPDAMYQHFSIPAYDDSRLPALELGERIKSLKSQVPPGVVLLSKLNPSIERVWLVDVRPGDHAVCSTEFLVLAPRPEYSRSYLYCLVCSSSFRRRLEGFVTGTSKSHQRAPANSTLGLTVVRPPKQLVRLFAGVVEPLLAQTLQCRQESRTLAALRDTLLPKLVSGELRVPDAERLAEEAA